MNKATQLLFQALGSNKALFKNQLELVTLLLNTKGSAYYLDVNASEELKSRALGRLKTFISQLFSDDRIRAITEDFKFSLKLVLATKIPYGYVEGYFDQVISALEQKNAALSKPQEAEDSAATKLSLKDDISSANYISVITSRPIDMDTNMAEDGFSIRKYFFDDLASTLTNQTEKQKFYRFNFPLDSYCELFWLGLEKIIRKFLLERQNQREFFRTLYDSKFSITTDAINLYEQFQNEKEGYGQEELREKQKTLFNLLSKEIIERLNRNKYIMVFSVDMPVFTIPTIAINPNESTAKVYSLLDFDNRKNLVYKFTAENMLLWRIFVWDKLKATEKGKNVPFKSMAAKP